MNIWHLRLYRQGAINILYSCRSGLFCNSQHNKPKKICSSSAYFFTPLNLKNMENDVASRAVAPHKALSSFLQGIHDFWRSTDDDKNRKQTFLRGSWKNHSLSPLKQMLSSLSQWNVQDLWTLLLLPWALSLVPCFRLSPVFCLYLHLSLTVPGNEVAFPCPK